jgi:predicted DCC family thiol-disulfide oxidoreductase YuxK
VSQTIPSGKPILIFDGDCGFCRHWIARWRRLTGEKIDYAPYQEVAGWFPTIPLARFQSAVQLVEPGKDVSQGAEAVFRTLGYARGLGWLLWVYLRVPGVATVSGAAYRFVANHRPLFSTLTRRIWSTDQEPPDSPS